MHTSGTEEGSRTNPRGWEQTRFWGCTGIGHNQNEFMPTPFTQHGLFTSAPSLHYMLCLAPASLSLEGAPRGLLEDQNRGKGNTHKLKHIALMAECDLLCNDCPSSGGMYAVLPSKAPCPRQKATTGVPASVPLPQPGAADWLSVTSPCWTQAHLILWASAEPWGEVYPLVGAWGNPSACPCFRAVQHTRNNSSVYTRVTQRRDGTGKTAS